jgi:hypothetical protein
MKKIAVEVLTRVTQPGQPLSVTFIVPADLSLSERIGIADALLNQLLGEADNTTPGGPDSSNTNC